MFLLAIVAANAVFSTKYNGNVLSSKVTTLNFVGDGVVASGNGATTTVAIVGAAVWKASDYVSNGKLWSSDIDEVAYFGASGSALFVSQIKIDAANTISNVSMVFSVNSATFSTGQNWIGLYQNDILVAQTADLSGSWTAVAADSIQTFPLVSPVALQAGYVSCAVVINALTGSASFYGKGLGVASNFAPHNIGSNLRAGYITPCTSLPTNLGSANGNAYQVWFALS